MKVLFVLIGSNVTEKSIYSPKNHLQHGRFSDVFSCGNILTLLSSEDWFRPPPIFSGTKFVNNHVSCNNYTQRTDTSDKNSSA